MKRKNFILKSFASLLAFVFGFSSGIMAQYGVMETYYKINGNISDLQNNLPIEGIKVAMKSKDNLKSVTDTDKNGNFSFNMSRWNAENTYFFTAEDLDGEANRGEFMTKDTSLAITYQDFLIGESKSHWDIEKTYRFGVNMKLLKKEEAMKDTAEKTNEPKNAEDSVWVAPLVLPKDTLVIGALVNGSANGEGWTMDEIFPNPTSGKVEIRIDSKTDEDFTIQLFDEGYKLLATKAEHLQSGVNVFSLDLEQYARGDYFVVLMRKEGRMVKKVVKL